MRRRSNRSASAPASGLRMTVGNRSAKAIRPSQVPDLVSCQASQPTATRCSHVPISEIDVADREGAIVALSQRRRDAPKTGQIVSLRCHSW